MHSVTPTFNRCPESGAKGKNMKLKWRLLLAIALAGVVCTAQAQVFWSVVSPQDGRNWLLGTVHSEDPRLLDFPPALTEALEEARILALELMPDAQMIGQLNQAMQLPNDERLDELIGPELYRRVVEILGAYGIGEPAVRRLRPWAVAITLSVPPPETGIFMDLALAFRAVGQGTEVISLETLDEQLDFLTGLGRDAHVAMVRQAVADFDRGRELFEALIGAYLERDLEELKRLADRELAGMSPEVQEHFRQEGLVERNRRIVERALPELEQGNLLIAVGTLHLPGEDGLIELLRERGYRVEPIY